MLYSTSFFLLKMEASFSSERRLLTAANYSQVFDNSCCKAGDDSFLLLARLNNLNHARLGLVIAKKKLKLAVDRNRVKRISRESFRTLQSELSGIDVIVLCRSGVVRLDKKEIRRRLDLLFDKINRSKKQIQAVSE